MLAGGIELVPHLHTDLMGETRWVEFKGQRSDGLELDVLSTEVSSHDIRRLAAQEG